MPYTYLPLQGDEIRLLTLEPDIDSGKDASPLSCRIEHVNLSPHLGLEQHRFKGDNYVWPEIQSLPDFASLFEDLTDPLLQESTVQEKKMQTEPDADEADTDEEGNRPFRYSWGDYMALSYVWGAAEGVRKRPILLNGEQFLVLPNLYNALLQLRRTRRIRQGFKLWVDAICIDQENSAERSKQVSRMRNIFASAWHVVIWLGTEEQNSVLAVTALRWLAMRSKGPEPLEGLYKEGKKIDLSPLFIVWAKAKSAWKKEVYTALFYLLTRPYWQRTWILQEVAMARPDAPIICGETCLSCKDVYDAAMLIQADQNRLGRDIIGSVRPRTGQEWAYEFARDRIPDERQWTAERMWKLLHDLMNLQREQRPEHDGSSDTTDPTGLLRVLLLGRDADVTQEQDRVYGTLGLRAVAERVDITPDYDLPLSNIFQDFTRQLLSRGELDILRLVSRPSGEVHSLQTLEDLAPGEESVGSAYFKLMKNSFKPSRASHHVGKTCSHDLPSWTVCWTCRPAPTAQLRGVYRAGGNPSPSTVSVHFSDTALVARGFIFDEIHSLGAFHPCEADTSYPQTDDSSQTANAYDSLEATQEALWRTLIGNTTAQGGPPSAEGSWLIREPRTWFRHVLGVYTNGFGLAEQMARNRDLALCGYTLQQIVLGSTEKPGFRQRMKIKSGSGLYSPSEEQWEVFSWAINAMAWRRLMGTRGGRMGTAPAAARIGDQIGLLLGCSMPLVLRKAGDGWLVIGECYVHGVMDGEVLASDKGAVSDVKIY
ncbi:heterokaryon incompatibility protein-domain-containing protein [Xylaria sp. FL0043]|nr:heterokaryon incompatibility protein-domain-containing protein [Xylaria sp. FL0043]